MASDVIQQGKRYKIFGPFPLDVEKRAAHRDALNDFWKAVEVKEGTASLARAVGVYVWTHVEGGKRLPWNVGLTNKQGFKSRFFQKNVLSCSL